MIRSFCFAKGLDLHGSTVGIVGLGRVGAAVAKRLTGFDCEILYYDVKPKPEVADPVGIVAWGGL